MSCGLQLGRLEFDPQKLLGVLLHLKVTIKPSLVAQMVKNLPVMQETWVRSLGGEDPVEKEMTTHSQYSCVENSRDRGAW